jgi:hypothetical protein
MTNYIKTAVESSSWTEMFNKHDTEQVGVVVTLKTYIWVVFSLNLSWANGYPD